MVSKSFKAAQYRPVLAALKGVARKKVDVHNGVCAHLDAHLADRTTAGVWIVHGAPPKEGDVGVGIMSRIVHTGPVPQSCAPPTSIYRRIWNALLNPENDLLLLLLPLFPHCHSSINDMDGRLDRGLVLSAF